MAHNWSPPPPRVICEIQALRGQIDMAIYVIEVTDYNFEVRCDLRLRRCQKDPYHLSNMHMNK